MAVTLTVDQLKAQVLITTERTAAAAGQERAYRAGQLPDSFWSPKLAAAAAIVERYAPAAPEAVQNEACLRVVSYLFDRSPGLSGRESYSQSPGQISALRHSGGMALLSPWKVRRGGAV